MSRLRSGVAKRSGNNRRRFLRQCFFLGVPRRNRQSKRNDNAENHGPKKYSPNHLVRPCQYIGRNDEADLFGGFEINDQLEFLGPLDGQVGGFCAF